MSSIYGYKLHKNTYIRPPNLPPTSIKQLHLNYNQHNSHNSHPHPHPTHQYTMLFKSLAIISAATAAFAAPVVCEKPQVSATVPVEHAAATSTQKYTLNLFPGAGVVGMKPLQVRGNNIVYGLEQGYSYFKLDAVGDNLADVESEGQSPKELYAADNGQLIVNEHPSKVGNGYKGGWEFKGDGSVQEVSYYGSQEFYSCTSKNDPLHGGQVVYVKKGDYACEDPIKFTVGATKE